MRRDRRRLSSRTERFGRRRDGFSVAGDADPSWDERESREKSGHWAGIGQTDDPVRLYRRGDALRRRRDDDDVVA